MKKIKHIEVVYTKELLAEMQQRSIEASKKRDREESLQRLRECYQQQEKKSKEETSLTAS
jgi:hypothetical protein